MFKKTIKILIAISLITLGILFAGTTNSQAAKTKDPIDTSGFFTSDKAAFAFHWENIKTNNGEKNVIIFGDFQTPILEVGYPTLVKYNKDTATINYQLTDIKGNLLAPIHTFTVKKTGSNSFKVYLDSFQTGRLPSTKGNSYTFSKTKTSPAEVYANKYSAGPLNKEFTNKLDAVVEAEYKASLEKGENVKDPASDPNVQSSITKNAADATAKAVEQMIVGFNTGSNQDEDLSSGNVTTTNN